MLKTSPTAPTEGEKPGLQHNGFWWAVIFDTDTPSVVQVEDGAVWITGRDLDVPHDSVRLIERVTLPSKQNSAFEE